MGALWQDVRIAVRMLRRVPSVTVPAVLVLTLGIGAATALYAVVYAAWLRPLPYQDSGRLVSVMEHFPSYKLDALESPDYGEWQSTRSLGPLAAYTIDRTAWIGSGETFEAGCARVSGNLLSVFGVHAVLGRNIEPADDSPKAAHVVLLCHGFWQERFGADRGVLGKTARIGNETYTIIGVLPPAFRMPDQNRVDLLIPLALDEQFLRHGNGSAKILRGVARLQPGVTLEKARAELSVRLAASRAREPQLYEPNVSLRIMPLEEYEGGDVRTASIVLLWAVASILAIASANVSSLLIARSAGRAGEMAVRIALGASALRIARHLLFEGLAIACMGITGGLLFAQFLVDLLQRARPAMLVRMEDVKIDGEVLAVALPVVLLCSLAFSLAPALRLPRIRVRRALVVGELALSLVLLAGAALLLQSLEGLRSIAPGFRTEQLVTASVSFSGTRPNGRAANLRQELRESLERAPGTMAVSFADALPPAEYTRASVFSRADRSKLDLSSRNDVVLIRLVDDRFFSAMGIPLLQGRLFTPADIAESALVAVVNRTLADHYFPGENVLGKLVDGDGKPWKTVIGVVAHTRNDGLRNATRPEIYLPFTERFKVQGGGITQSNGLKIVIRTAADPAVTGHILRRLLHELDPTLLANIGTMDTQWANLTAGPQFEAAVLAGFAVLALILACVGIYGVLSHMVVLRRREIGIRLALGARPGNIRSLILREALALAVGGIVLGLGGALAASRLLGSLLYEIKPQDPLTFAATAAVLLVLAVCASVAPAQRATREDPSQVLRAE